MTAPPILTSRYLPPIMRARKAGETSAATSLDLGISETEVQVTSAGIVLPDGQAVSWDVLEDISADKSGCYAVQVGEVQKIHAYSTELHRDYSLFATDGAPTLINSGFTMHRIVRTHPWEDTLRKIQTIAPVTGRVLDTATGLGYTAITAAETAQSVTTIEFDPLVLDICRLNPWSQRLFDNPRIKQLVGDTYILIDTLPDDHFTRVIHDPPAFNLAGELYSLRFYQDLYRVMAPGARMYHYVGDLSSGYGRRYTPGIIRRLHEAGFSRVVPKPDAFGLVVVK